MVVNTRIVTLQAMPPGTQIDTNHLFSFQGKWVVFRLLRLLPQAPANNTCSGTQPFGLRLRDQRSLTMGKKRSPPKLVLKKVTVYRSQDDELSIQLYPNLPK